MMPHGLKLASEKEENHPWAGEGGADVGEAAVVPEEEDEVVQEEGVEITFSVLDMDRPSVVNIAMYSTFSFHRFHCGVRRL